MHSLERLGAVIADIQANLERIAPEQRLASFSADAERLERLAPFRGVVTDDDFRRIIRDELDTKAAKTVRAFTAARDTNPRARFLWLTGSLGVGKTVAALWAIAEVGGRYATSEEVRRAYAQEHDEARYLRPRLVDCRLLVVDDVGTAKDESGEERALFELLNARQGGRRQTILTGNLSRAEVSQRFRGRVMDRVFHSGAVVDCGNRGLRRKEVGQ